MFYSSASTSLVTRSPLNEVSIIIERCLNSAGLLEYTIEIADHKIQVLIANSTPEQVNKLITPLIKRAKLSIHAVHRQSEKLAYDATNGKMIPDYSPFIFKSYDNASKDYIFSVVIVKTKPAITAEDVKVAWVSPQDYSVVNIQLTSEGGDKMREFTKSLTKNIDRIATVLDDKVVNYATLAADSLGKDFVINGLDSKQEAEALVQALKNPLSHDITIIKQVTIDPSKPK